MRRNRFQVTCALVVALFSLAGVMTTSTMAAALTPTAGPLPVTCPSGARVVGRTDSIQAAIQAAGSGGSLCVKPGIYRFRTPLRPLAGQTLTFERGAILSGARVTTGWRRSGTRWVLDNQRQDFSTPSWLRTYVCKDNPSACILEGLFRDGVPLKHVMTLSALAKGKVYFNNAKDRMFIIDDPRGHRMEATVLAIGIEPSGAGVTIRGAVIEKMGWLGINATAPGSTIEDCEIRYVQTTGLRLVGNDHVVRRNFIHHNGNTGIQATDGSRLLMEANEVAFNNYLHFGGRPVPHHEGGAKFLRTSDVTLRGNYSHHNDGDGWWFDTDNIRVIVEDNVFKANTRYGFFYETSYDAVIRNNVFRRNATDPTWNGSHLRITTSKNVEVVGNRFEDSGWSTLSLDWMDRGMGAYGEHQLTGLFVHDNVFQLSNGWVGTPYGFDAITAAPSNNRFQANRYIVPDVSASWWMWGPGRRIGWAKWNAFGFDLGGSVEVG